MGLRWQIPGLECWGPPFCLNPIPRQGLHFSPRPVRLLPLGKAPLRATYRVPGCPPHTHLSFASSELGVHGAGGLLASLPGVSRCQAWSPGLASFPASASAKLFLASRGAGRTAGSAARVNFCGSRMSRTEKEILWWEGAALAPPSCHASMPAVRGPEAGGAGSGMAALGFAFGSGSAAALQAVGGSGRPSEAGEGDVEEGRGEMCGGGGLHADWHLRGPGPRHVHDALAAARRLPRAALGPLASERGRLSETRARARAQTALLAPRASAQPRGLRVCTRERGRAEHFIRETPQHTYTHTHTDLGLGLRPFPCAPPLNWGCN